MKMSRLLSAIIAILLVSTTLFVACNGCATNKPAEKKIVIWHWMNDRKAAFDVLAQKYKDQTGITVEFMLFSPADIYTQKVVAAARAGKLPDIFGILGEKSTVASFINAGHILDLTPYMTQDNQSWQNRFYPQTLNVVTFDNTNSYGVKPGVYGVPIDTTLHLFVYNKSLFKQAGLNPDNPPKTFDEFIRDAKLIKEKTGAEGFMGGWAEGWMLNVLATEWAINVMGEDQFYKTIKGDIPYSDPKWVEVFSLFAKLREANILSPNITTTINKEAEDAFSKNKAAFSFNGTWAVNVYKQLAPNLDYGFFALPQISANYPVKVWGGAGSSFRVSAKSTNATEAVNFLKWLTSYDQQIYLIEQTNNLPSINQCEDKLPAMLKDLASNLSNLTHDHVWPYNEDSRVVEIRDKNLQQVVIGSKTPADALKEIDEVKKRVAR